MWQYTWNANGSLKSVKKPSGQTISFEYDALGRRTAKRSGNKEILYIWSGNVLLHEVLKTNDNEQVITWVYEQGSFVPTAKLIDGESFSIVSDYIGRPVLAFDENGEKVWSADYDIYGKLINLQGDKSFIPFRQLGQYEDGKTGLTDNGPLMVTHGCLRVYNKDMPIIQKIYTEQVNKGKKVYVYVEETADLKNMFTNYGTKPDPKDTITRKNKKYDPQ